MLPLVQLLQTVVNLGQVELLVAGVGVFQGSYNANTNTPVLSGASNVAS